MANTPLSSGASRSRPAALARWLWGVALLVILVVAVGGITRLTESGLSITEWKPVSGVLPPLRGGLAGRVPQISADPRI